MQNGSLIPGKSSRSTAYSCRKRAMSSASNSSLGRRATNEKSTCSGRVGCSDPPALHGRKRERRENVTQCRYERGEKNVRDADRVEDYRSNDIRDERNGKNPEVTRLPCLLRLDAFVAFFEFLNLTLDALDSFVIHRYIMPC